MRNSRILLIVTVLVIVGTFVATLFTDQRPQLGLDLKGGISVRLFPENGTDPGLLDSARQIIDNRVNGLGVAEPEVSRQGDTIVVDLPGVKDRERALQLVGTTAELLNREVLGGPLAAETPIPTTTTTKPKTTTTKLGATTTTKAGATTTTKAGATTTTKAGATATTTKTGATTTTTLGIPKPGQTCKDLVPKTPPKAQDSNWFWDVKHTSCYVLGPSLLKGTDVVTASALYNSQDGGWGVDVTYKDGKFAPIATGFVDKRVAIVLDSLVLSAPTINAGITGNDVRISGSFTEGEAKSLAQNLKYGSLPVRFDKKQQTVENVSPSLGKDQLRAGILAGIFGLVLVALYMLLFYRVLGLVVWAGLALTGMVMFTLVTWLGYSRGLTLTLAGVTGIIVSVGITVDSYVVYFERLKDEVRTGKTIRSAVDTGWKRAWRTIVAADSVSLIGAVVLYAITVGSVKGFAYFLGLSTLVDLALAVCFMHPLVSIMARRSNLVAMRGMGIASGLDVAGRTAV